MASTTKLIIMSDSHGDREVIAQIKRHYQDQADVFFHNGDSELAPTDPVLQDVLVVAGNCDRPGLFPNNMVATIDGLVIAQTHGHLYGINFSWQKLDYWAQQEGADICIYGHLHVPSVEKRGATLFINPGSVSQPRGAVQEKLYVLLTIEESQILVDFYTLDHEPFAHYQFDR
ncbi:metallophosphoesterase [Streptococcus sp. DD13]|uniref:metallophosphoesterase n=1 Tax=Streptococcus sp. DD13 TaxID=1777881 RepID=UPI00079B4F2D|nr:metallophosphoesterase [Streptococcus sp. DD13]KXT78187.1 phosphoesterase [Streptococcus sp. DD13]